MMWTFILSSKKQVSFYTIYESSNGGIRIPAMKMHYKVKNDFRKNSNLK